MSNQDDAITILVKDLELPPLQDFLGQCQLLRGATSAATGEVFRWEHDGHAYLVKSFARKNCFSRFFFGRSGIANEWRILRALHGLQCAFAPAPVARLGRYTILMEFIQGETLQSPGHYRRNQASPPPPEFFMTLREILEQFHQAGVVHGDFRRANIMIQPDGTPRIIDWATGVLADDRRILYHQFYRSDLYSLVKILTDYYPELVTEEERKTSKPGPLLRIGRFLRQKIYRHYIKPIFRRKHKADA